MKSHLKSLPLTVLLASGCLTASPAGQSGDKTATAAAAKSAPPPEQPGATLEALFDELDQQDAALWQVSDGYSNGPLFHCGWRKDNARFDKGSLILTLDDSGC